MKSICFKMVESGYSAKLSSKYKDFEGNPLKRNDRQDGLISRFFARKSDTHSKTDVVQERVTSSWADNTDLKVTGLVKELLNEPSCLIVTGYQDFLSTLSILLKTVTDLNERPPGSIRIVFGTNSENSQKLGGEGRPVAEVARNHFLGAHGFAVDDLADLRAVMALNAIEQDIISLRAYEPALAETIIGRRPPMLHAKLFVGEKTVLSGSANFSYGGLRRNLEFMDDVGHYPDLFSARKESAERFWEMGIDWKEDALNILRNLIRLVTPEEAIARTTIEAKNFVPWRVAGDSSAGRPPQPFQADLVYEASGTIYEHGFAFVEAPTGAGKTDIGKHLATALPVSHSQTVFSFGERADQRRLGSLALIPASVFRNWTTNAPTNFRAIKHSYLSKSRKDENEELKEINRAVRSSAAMIVDESHRLSSRYLSPSARSEVFESSPAIWTACLSATLMGNQGLDGLLAFHEKRASIYVPPTTTDRINEHMAKVRERGALLSSLDELKKRIEEQQNQEDLFETSEQLQNRAEVLEQDLTARGLTLQKLQSGLADALSPYVVRRQRDCIGESSVRRKGAFVYPTIKSHRRDADLSSEQKRIIERIKLLAETITTGSTLVSADPKRAAKTEIKFHDKSRIHIRNFLAVLRASVTFAREEWMRERDSEADQRGRASIGESLRRAESQNKNKLEVPQGALPDEDITVDEPSDTPICDRIRSLLLSPILNDIDERRADEMRKILKQHGHVIFLAERVGVLETYAKLLAGGRGRGPEIFVVAPGAKIKTGKKLIQLRSGAKAQEYFGLDGANSDPFKPRAMFMTFQMAEGINLQMASALGIVGVTSDVKSLIQGLGRIDRIDSPHSKIHYYTFDLPGLVLSSDQKARNRVANIALLSGVGAEDLPSELVEFAAGDLTDLILEQIHQPRVLRQNNYFDLLEMLDRILPEDVLQRIKSAEPKGLWGSEICLLASAEPLTVLMLGGRFGDAKDATVLPPRLIAVRERNGQAQIVGDQAEAARLLKDAYIETQRQGLHNQRPSLTDLDNILSRLTEDLENLIHWDIRPARTVSLLSSLADFLTDGKAEDLGRTLFGDLTLPALEKLAELWANELDPFWIEGKQGVSQKSAAGDEIPDYLGIEAIYSAFRKQPESEIEASRKRMVNFFDYCCAMSEGMEIDILSRVAVVFGPRRAEYN